MTAFPDSVSFKLVDQNGGQPVSNVAVQLTLYAHRKDNYHVGFVVSDQDGIVTFTRTDCLKEIESSKLTFLMDYASTLEECLPKVSLEIILESQIKKSIELRRTRKELFQKWDCSEEYIRRLETCNNHLYVPDQVFFEEAALWQPGPITIKIKRRKTGEKSA